MYPIVKNPWLQNLDLDKELSRDKPKLISTPVKLKSKTAKLFLKGPIPFDWLQAANSLGGSAGIVATGLWLYVGLNSSKKFKIDGKLDTFSGVTRQTRQHMLRRLQSAGLIKMTDLHGAYPVVEVIPNSGFA
jgi:hypothetical protein